MVVKDPGERTSIAQGSYLNFVSRKLVKVSPSRNAAQAVSKKSELSGKLWRNYMSRQQHRAGSAGLLVGLEALLRIRLLSSFCMLHFDC
jgi:hypothetical protein